MAKNPKFRIWATIWWGYRYTFQNIKLMFRCASFMGPAWLLFLGVVPAFAFWIQDDLLANIAGTVEYVTVALIFITVAHFAVAWHRSVLLNEKQPSLLRFGRTEAAYFGITFGIWLIGFLPDFLKSLGPDVGFMSDETPRVIWVIVRVVVVLVPPIFGFVVYCLMPILLPAISIKDSKMSLDIAWNNMRGWRLRFILFWYIESAVWIGSFIGVFYSMSFIRGPVSSLLGMEYPEGLYGLFQMMALETLLSIPTVITFMVTTGGMLAGLSISYAGLARQALKNDRTYKPFQAFGERLSV